jgi:AcrR family transcriptional regulator
VADLDATRLRILEAAGPRFASKGFDGTSVREITDAAGVNVAAINYHFRSKDELYVEAVRLAALSCAETTPLPEPTDALPPEQRLRDFVRVFLTRLRRDDVPEWHRELIMRELAQPRCGATEVFVESFVKPTFTALSAILRDLVPAGVSVEEIHLVGSSIVGQCLHYHHARNVIPLLVGPREYKGYAIERLSEHVWRFSLAAIRGLYPAPGGGRGAGGEGRERGERR